MVTNLVTTSTDCNSAREGEHAWVLSGETNHGAPVLYRLTRDAFWSECADCLAGVCVQRVETCEAWDRLVVVHAFQRTAN